MASCRISQSSSKKYCPIRVCLWRHPAETCQANRLGYRASVISTPTIGAANQLNAALAGSAALVAAAFALSTFDRWHRRGQPHEMAWTVAMTLFTIGSGALWWAEATGWSMFAFRVFFLAGAVLNVAWLALGTIYLLANKTFADQLRRALVVLSAFSTGVIAVAPTKREITDVEFPAARELFGLLPRVMAAVGSGLPALVIIFGALWSTWRVIKSKAPNLKSATQRKVISPRRLALGNLFVALGTLVLSASGTLAGRLGKDRAFAITLLVGLCILFVGFLVASNATRSQKELPADN
jgi:hypothetical protein